MDKTIKVRITYNTGFVLETNMSEYTFDFYTKERHELYHPRYPYVNVNVGDTEFITLYGAVKLERCE